LGSGKPLRVPHETERHADRSVGTGGRRDQRLPRRADDVAAGAPFDIQHGFGLGANEPPTQAGIYAFRLDVDGVPRAADFVDRSTDAPPKTVYDGPVLNRSWIFNFPDGMTGDARVHGALDRAVQHRS
jgi:hypothetical protein